EVRPGDRKAVGHLLERHDGAGLEALRGDPGLLQLEGERHGEAAGMRGGDQLLGIGALLALEALAERDGRRIEDATRRGEAALALLGSAFPNGGRPVAGLHVALPPVVSAVVVVPEIVVVPGTGRRAMRLASARVVVGV